MARKLRVFAWFNFLTPSPFLPFHSFPSHRVFLRHITVRRSLTLPNPNSFSPPYSTLVLIPLLSPFLPLPIFSSYSLNPRPGTSLLHWSHSLPPSFTTPTDLPLSSSTFIFLPPFASLHTLHLHLPFPSLLSLPHVLPPPTDLPLSSFTLFPFPLHRSPSYPSLRILRSRPSIPCTPPISLLFFHYLMSFLLLQTIPSLVSFPFLPLPCHAPQVTNALFS